jgi:hypothetical protein
MINKLLEEVLSKGEISDFVIQWWEVIEWNRC